MIRLLYVLFVSFQVINRIMRCFQFIKLETARLTNNKRGIVRIISVCGYIFRKLIVHVAKSTDAEFTMFSRHYGKKFNGLELLNWRRLRSKSYFRLLTWPKTIDKSNQWATFFSINDCHSPEEYSWSDRCEAASDVIDRSTRCVIRYFFEQFLLIQTSFFSCQKLFHSLPKMKIKRNGRLVNIRWPYMLELFESETNNKTSQHSIQV